MIEYLRVVYVEMDFFIVLVRNNKEIFVDKILYVMIYLCYNCVWYIVVVGIKKVVYVEFYEKSLVMKFYDDFISDNVDVKNKVCFLLFEGVLFWCYEVFF